MTRHQRKHLGVQILRRSAQLLTVALIAGLVFLNLYAHYRAARALDDLETMEGFTGEVMVAIDDTVGALDNPEKFLDGFKGNIWSMRFAGFDISDPLAGVELFVASKTFHLPMFLSILFPLFIALVLGRVFCSWICPGYLLFEIGGKLRGLIRFAELPSPEVRFSHWNKYIFLGVGLLIATVVSRPIFALIYPPAVISRLIHAWIFSTALTGTLLMVGAVLAFEVLVSPRWFCRSLCPGGALLGLVGAFRPLRVKLDADKCTACGLCVPVCQEGLDPVVASTGIECDNCGECIRSCPEEALGFALSCRKGATSAKGKVGSSSLVALIVSASLGLVALDAMVPANAYSHHILGLPHYSYKENYPQVPTLEYPATTGPYDVLLTSYPGKPKPGEAANLSFYIKDRNTGEPYAEALQVRVLQTYTFGRNRELVEVTDLIPFDQVHKTTVSFDMEGEYIVEISMEVEGRTEVIPFLMVVGDPSSGWAVLGATGFGLALFIVVVRAVKIKRERRAATRTPPLQDGEA